MVTTDGMIYLAVEMRKILSEHPAVAEYNTWLDWYGESEYVPGSKTISGFKSFKGKIVSSQNHNEWVFTVTHCQDSNPRFKIEVEGIRNIKTNDEIIDIVSIPHRTCTINHTKNGIVCEFTTTIELPWEIYGRTPHYMHEHAKKCIEIIMATGSKDEITKMEYDSVDS